MTKTAWNCKIWWNFEPEGQHDPDWTQIWTLGAWPNPKSGFKLGNIARLLAWTWISSDFLIIPTHFFTLRANPNPISDPEGPNWVRVRPWGPKMGWYDQNIGPIWGSRWNLRNNPKLNPLLGLDQAPRVQIWVQSGSCWPLGSEFHQILKFQAVLVIFHQQKNVFKNNYVCSN